MRFAKKLVFIVAYGLAWGFAAAGMARLWDLSVAPLSLILVLPAVLMMDRVAGLFGVTVPPREDPKPLPLDEVHDHLDNRRRY